MGGRNEARAVNDGSEPEPRYAWVMAAIGTTLVAMNFGAFGSIPVFLKPVSAEFAWPRGATSLAYTVGTLAIACGGIVWARLADRRGTRPVVLVGALAQPAALFLLSGLGSLPEFYLCYMLLGGVGFAAVNVPIIANVGLWFTRNKGLALGIVSAGGALGQGVVPFVAAQLISASGWRGAYLALAIAYLLVGPPLALMVRTPPPLAGSARGGAASGAGADFPLSPVTAVTWLSVAAIFCCVTMAVPIVHTVSMLTDRGVPYDDAVRVFFVIMASGVLGRVILGRLTDHLGGLRSYLLTSAVQTTLLFWFTRLRSLPALYLLSALFGIGFSGVMTALWVCVRELVPARLAATSLAVVVFFGWAGMGLGGWHGGHVFDLMGGYTRAYADATLAGIVNLIIVGALIRRVRRAAAAPQVQLGPSLAGNP